MENRLFEPGINCWRSVVSARSAFLVDGETYFRTLHDALGRATHQVVVLGWDLHSQVRLIRGEAARNVAGASLEQRLHDVLDNSPDLHVYLLNWDYSVVFLLEREWLPDFSLPWSRRPRLRFETDDELPAGASHHQKVVVIDDAIAFSGGFDLTHARWDTSAHRRYHPDRVTPGGEAYGPFHDVQAIIAGDAAAALGDLARQRWKRATGELLAAPPALSWQDRWPAHVEPSYEDTRVAIARTSASYGGSESVTEVQHAYLDQIRSARTYLYFENQYLTSTEITAALCERLTEKDGPEIVIVLPREASGWLEEATMGEGRDRAAARLRAADTNDRLRILCPVTGGKPGTAVNVHSKLLITDDRWIRVGSANLSNRSMTLDTECDLVFDVGDRPEIARAFLARLIGEHAGSGNETAAAALESNRSLIAAIESLHSEDRGLEPLQERRTDELLAPALELADPERPLEPVALRRLLGAPGQSQGSRKTYLRRLLLALGGLVLIGIAWRVAPLDDWLAARTLAELKAFVAAAPWSAAVAVFIFPVASLFVAPVMLLIVVCAVIFGAYEGFAISVVGALLAAALNYAIGAFAGRDLVRRLAGRRVNQISRRLARQGILTVAAIRLVPVAPFTIVNVVAGASHIRLRDFMLGTLLGMGPGTAVLSWLAGNADSMLAGPEQREVSLFLTGLGILIATVVALRAWVRRRRR